MVRASSCAQSGGRFRNGASDADRVVRGPGHALAFLPQRERLRLTPRSVSAYKVGTAVARAAYLRCS